MARSRADYARDYRLLDLARLGALFVAYESRVLKRELRIRYESFLTGTPAATIIAQQNASSGMWGFGEGWK